MSEKALEILADFCDALEAAAVNVKHQIAELQGVAQKSPSWNPEKIKWEQAQGSSGPYERSEDVNSLDFKALLKDLAPHGGKLTQDGYFYWQFEKSAIIGRKKRGKQESKASEIKPEKISEVFPEELRSLLSFEQKEGFCIVRARQFLGSENFAKIASIVQQQGGDYVSAGKESHFRVPIKS